MPSRIKSFIRGDDLKEVLKRDEKPTGSTPPPAGDPNGTDYGTADSYNKVPAANPSLKVGLTDEDIKVREEFGLTNAAQNTGTRTTKEIIKKNVFTYFNMIFVILAILLISVGSYTNLFFLVIVTANALIGIIQELRSKKAVDQLSILAEEKVKVRRNGKTLQLPSSQLVRDDIVEFSTGQQVCADAIVRYGELSVNESLLTGESDAIKKAPGDELKSGSTVVTGRCIGQLTRVGSESYASRLTAQAKSDVEVGKSEMMASLDKLIKVIGILLVPVGIYLFVSQKVGLDMTWKATVQSTVAALLGMIPEGLYLLTSVALALSVMRLSRRKVLVRDMNCVETLARVDVICVDKTGTITEPGMDVQQLLSLDGSPYSEEELRDMLNAFYTYMEADNDTAVAMKKAFHKADGAPGWVPAKVVPFMSENKYSGITFEGRGSYLLGAPEFILGDRASEVKDAIDPWANQGMRVLLLAHTDGLIVDDEDNNVLDKTRVRPIGIVCIANRIREDADKTFQYFAQQGVTIKVISGDNPVTVSQVAKQACIENADKYIDATTLQTDADIYEAIQEYTVFGRVTPQQKLKFVQALKDQGHTVAMTGDGVNDVLALKEANCGIAMASGSQAASQISSLVLLNSDFKSMPSIVDEGRQVINNIQRSASLFLVKNIFSFIFAILAGLAGWPYPLQPLQLSLISSLTIGTPAFLLSLEPNHERFHGHFLSNVLYRAAPGGLADVVLLAGIELFCAALGLPNAQLYTISCIVMLTVGNIMIWLDSQPLNKYRRMVCILFSVASVAAISIIPFTMFRDWVQLAPLTGKSWLVLIVFMLLAYPVVKGFEWLLNKIREAYENHKTRKAAKAAA